VAHAEEHSQGSSTIRNQANAKISSMVDVKETQITSRMSKTAWQSVEKRRTPVNCPLPLDTVEEHFQDSSSTPSQDNANTSSMVVAQGMRTILKQLKNVPVDVVTTWKCVNSLPNQDCVMHTFQDSTTTVNQSNANSLCMVDVVATTTISKQKRHVRPDAPSLRTQMLAVNLFLWDHAKLR